MPTLERLSPLDSAFLHVETRNAHMHIGGVGIFDGGSTVSASERFALIRRQVEGRLHLIPRLRQRVMPLPLNLDDPFWVDDEDFALDFHLRRAAIPHPGGERELRKLVEQVFSRPLDRRRPLWELYIVEGLKAGRWAAITKTHHSLVDGLSVLSVSRLLLDPTPEPEPTAAPRRWHPHHQRTLQVLLGDARQRATEPARALRRAVGGGLGPRRVAHALVERGTGVTALLRNLDLSPSPINGPTGPTRAVAFSRFALDDFKSIKNTYGATVNDVVMAVVSGGLRRYLERRGNDVDALRLKAFCPVSVRNGGDGDHLGNELSMLLVPLAVDEKTAGARMTTTKARLDERKRDGQALGANVLRQVAAAAPGPLHPLLARSMGWLAGFNTIVTNIPGPPVPLYCVGCRMVEALPVAFLYEGQWLAISILSYDGQVNFGFITDGVALPDVQRLATCMEQSLQELRANALGQVRT